MKTKFLLLVLGILLIAGMGSAVDITTCYCECQGTEIEAKGVGLSGCAEACGGICGGYTDCSGPDCEACCSRVSPGYCGDPLKMDCSLAPDLDKCKEGCENACKSTCELKKTINGIRDIIYYIAGIIAAIMFVILGYKFITSDNPEDRSEVKRGIMYVIMALIIIIIAMPLVNLLIGTVGIMPTAVIQVQISGITFTPVSGVTTVSFDVVNAGGGVLTNVIVNVNAFACGVTGGESFHSENLGNIGPGSSGRYSYNNFCHGVSMFFEINIRSNEGSRMFCVRDCYGGTCHQITIGSC